jgi:hypothetical protein
MWWFFSFIPIILISPLNHRSPPGLDHLVHHLLYDYLDQDLMLVE